MSDGLLTLQEAAEYLSVSYDWLQRQAAARKVPHTRIGDKRHVRFSRDHLAAIVRAGEQEPIAPAPTASRRSTARSTL